MTFIRIFFLMGFLALPALCIAGGAGQAPSPFFDNAIFDVGDDKDQQSLGGANVGEFSTNDVFKVGNDHDPRKPAHRDPATGTWSNTPSDLD